MERPRLIRHDKKEDILYLYSASSADCQVDIAVVVLVNKHFSSQSSQRRVVCVLK